MENSETDALLVDYMDSHEVKYTSLGSNGTLGQPTHSSSTEDEDMLDIAMDGRDAQGIDREAVDRSQGQSVKNTVHFNC